MRPPAPEKSRFEKHCGAAGKAHGSAWPAPWGSRRFGLSPPRSPWAPIRTVTRPMHRHGCPGIRSVLTAGDAGREVGVPLVAWRDNALPSWPRRFRRAFAAPGSGHSEARGTRKSSARSDRAPDADTEIRHALPVDSLASESNVVGRCSYRQASGATAWVDVKGERVDHSPWTPPTQELVRTDSLISSADGTRRWVAVCRHLPTARTRSATSK